MMENMAAMVAEYENGRRATLTTAGMKAKVKAGGWPFPAPLGFFKVGFRKASRLVPDPERAPLVRKIFELMATGLYQPTQVLEIVTRLGLRTRKGKPVPMQTFHRILRNPLYSGVVAVGPWQMTERAESEAIVAPEAFQRVQEMLAGKRTAVTGYIAKQPRLPATTVRSMRRVRNADHGK